MNAYELADELDRVLQIAVCDNRVPVMLRQQADHIAELEKEVNFLRDWRDTWSPFIKEQQGIK